MRDFLGVLAISGLLAAASSLAVAQTEGAARDSSAAQSASSTPPSDSAPVPGSVPAANSAQLETGTPIPPEDLQKALSEVRASWRNYEKCARMKLCSAYFESFGVGLTFNDGRLEPFSHTQRLTASQHDCIVNARDALGRGDRALAVQWVMASQMQEPLNRNWLGDHPDAVLEALRQCCG